MRARVLRMLLAVVPLLVATTHVSAAAPALETLGGVMEQDYSPVIRTFVLLSLLSFLPALLIGVTSFTRIIIVLALLRHALGIPQTPPNSVIVTLAVFLSLFAMAPVVEEVNAIALQPYLEERVSVREAIDLAKDPVRNFVVRQTREADLAAVMQMAGAEMPKTVEDVSFTHLVPAFMLSELKTAFQIGFVIFLPFLLIDLVVAASLMSLGMIMVPPTTVSLPLKLLLFILIDGWVLVSQALLGSYMT